MTGMDLFNAIDGVDEALLDDVHDEKPRRSAAPLLWKFAAAAAAVALCVGVGIRLISLKQNGLPHRTTAISGSASSGTSS
ncbi:MAG: hypothetical protein IJL26_12445, partial [Clostridia bacterium]|nr:hypothetical protein [Clostridia bacterium]